MKRRLAGYSNELTLLGILAALFALLGALSPTRFLSAYNLSSMCFQMPEFGLLALAMMVAILTGGINLSICYTATLSSIVAALILKSGLTAGNEAVGILLAVGAAIAVSLVCGALNGGVVAYVGAAAMIVTLGTMQLLKGVATNITKGGAISGYPAAFKAIGNGTALGVPVPMLVYLLAAILAYYLLQCSSWGAKVYMLGSNELATRFSGVNTKHVLFKAYALSGLLSGVAGVVMMSRYNSARVDYGSSYLMMSISAVVLGGTSISGGQGTVLGTVLSVAIIQTVNTGLNILGVNRYLIDMVIGAILIAVLAARYGAARRTERRLIQSRAALAAPRA